MWDRLKLLRLSPIALLAACASFAGNSDRTEADLGALPPRTVMLSRMMQELSERPGFTEALLAQIDKSNKSGAALTPKLFDLLRKLILGKDWTGLDRFPGWTIERVTKTVDLGTSLMKNPQVEPTEEAIKVQLGSYGLNGAAVVSLDNPSTLPGFSSDGLVTAMGAEVTHGDGPDARLAPLHSESERLALMLNRLALNGFSPEGRQTPRFAVEIAGEKAETPEQLIAALQKSGHSVVVADARYFANFGHFHFKGQDVEVPFFLDSGLRLPGQHWWQPKRRFLIPVAHAEYEWIVSGPKVNADVTFYFGIDGRAEFRTNDQLNQSWVMGRFAHEYGGTNAVEVTRLTGLLLRAYAYLHLAHPELPLGGYYTLGVCQDVVAAIEQKMTGTTTIYPNTAQTAYFHDQPDDEVFQLMDAIPKDTAGKVPAPECIFGSLPTENYAKLTVPGLRVDVQLAKAAWREGRLPHEEHTQRSIVGVFALVLGVFLIWGVARSKKRLH